MATWKKVSFVTILVLFIGLSVVFTFYSIARDTFEFEYKTSIANTEGFDGWVFYGFNGNTSTKSISIDYVRDKKGGNPDESKPIVAVDDFTLVSDEYVEFISISKDVKYIDPSSFFYCKKLKAVSVDEQNPNYCSVDGCLYTKDKKTLVLHPIKNGEWLKEQGKTQEADTFTVPEGVVTLGAYSFYKNEDLVHLTLASTVEHIGDMAFFGCGGMWTVWLPEGLKTIGADTFGRCWSMSPIMYIPASVTKIDHHAFYSCSSLKVFYMGAASKDAVETGEDWLPKTVNRGVIWVAPKPEYNKTAANALAEKERLDGQEAQP